MPFKEARCQTPLKPADKCIYCGATEKLSDEHIIPFGLGGNLYVPRASCLKCSDITSRFERGVLKGFMERARIVGNLPTRRPKTRSTEVEITLLDGDEERKVMLSSREAPAMLHLPIFERARCLDGREKITGITVCGRETIGFGDVRAVAKGQGATGFRQTDTINGGDFVRMLAKIGYSYTVGVLGIIPLERIFVLPLILGKSNDAGHWIGSAQFETESEKVGSLHALTHVAYHADSPGPDPLLVARIKLFASSGASGYEVVICRLADIPVINTPTTS